MYLCIEKLNVLQMKNIENSNQTGNTNTFDRLIQSLVEKALLNVSEPLIEGVVEKVISRKLNNAHEDPLDIEQAALFLKKAKQTIYGYCSKKTIPHHYSGSAKLIFFKTELLEWLKSK
jgi:predicted DNA-binding transcriptional regulator AlpA